MRYASAVRTPLWALLSDVGSRPCPTPARVLAPETC